MPHRAGGAGGVWPVAELRGLWAGYAVTPVGHQLVRVALRLPVFGVTGSAVATRDDIRVDMWLATRRAAHRAGALAPDRAEALRRLGVSRPSLEAAPSTPTRAVGPGAARGRRGGGRG